jgi:hypothetical protein
MPGVDRLRSPQVIDGSVELAFADVEGREGVVGSGGLRLPPCLGDQPLLEPGAILAGRRVPASPGLGKTWCRPGEHDHNDEDSEGLAPEMCHDAESGRTSTATRQPPPPGALAAGRPGTPGSWQLGVGG